MIDHQDLMYRTRTVLHLLQSSLATEVGVSVRTGVRWSAGQSTPSAGNYRTMAALVYPHDPKLAAELAAAGDTTLEALGVAAPETLTVRAPADQVVNVVVCAAAEAMDASPRAMRPALLAAVRSALSLGFTLQGIEKALTPAPVKKKKA